MTVPTAPRCLLLLAGLASLTAVTAACGSSTEVLEREDGSGGATTGTSSGGCTSDAECIEANGGLPYLCRSGTCASMLTSDCSEVIGDLTALAEGRAIAVGALAPLSGPEAATGRDQVDAIALAVGELDSTSGGIPLGGTERASVVVVVCDEVVDVSAVTAHLVDALGLPLVLGPSDGERALVAAGVAIAAGAMLLSPSADHPSLTTLADQGLVWQAAPVSAHGLAMAVVGAQLEQAIGGGPVRAVLAVADDARGAAVAESFLATLQLNGTDAPGNLDSGALAVITLGVEPDTAAAAATIVDFEPDLVFLAMPAPADLVEAVEGAIAVPPRWIAAPVPDGAAALAAELPGRFFAVRVGAPTDRDLHDAFSIRFASTYGASPSFPAVEAYDATYVAFALLAALGETAPTGAALAGSTSRLLPPGTPSSVGPADLVQTFSALAAGANVDLLGATGSLDADIATGAFPRSHHALCSPDGTLEESGVVIDEDGSESGRSTCL